MSNVYSKLQDARCKLQSMKLNKSGHNKFAGYNYFELGDFLPQINSIFSELKLASFTSFDNEYARLTIINTEKPDERIEFTSPMAEANLKGCHPIQNLGAVQTYSRRYLYVTALEIVEHDALDATTGDRQPVKTTEADVEKLYYKVFKNKDKAAYEQFIAEQSKTYSMQQIKVFLNKKMALAKN